jgi:hypothetical protein
MLLMIDGGPNNNNNTTYDDCSLCCCWEKDVDDDDTGEPKDFMGGPTVCSWMVVRSLLDLLFCPTTTTTTLSYDTNSYVPFDRVLILILVTTIATIVCFPGTLVAIGIGYTYGRVYYETPERTFVVALPLASLVRSCDVILIQWDFDTKMMLLFYLWFCVSVVWACGFFLL